MRMGGNSSVKQVCGKVRLKQKNSILYWPSVPFCVRLHLYRITLFTGSILEVQLQPHVQEIPTNLQIPAELNIDAQIRQPIHGGYEWRSEVKYSSVVT